jgi:hypothetical protein
MVSGGGGAVAVEGGGPCAALREMEEEGYVATDEDYSRGPSRATTCGCGLRGAPAWERIEGE